MTPFDSVFAENYIDDILSKIGKNQFPDAVAYIIHMTIENHNDGIFDDDAEKYCYEVWTAGCLLDAVFNHADYTSNCQHYVDRYIKVVKNIEDAFQKTEPGSSPESPLYNRTEILADMAHLVSYIGLPYPEEIPPDPGVPCDENGEAVTKLGEKMMMLGKLDEWWNDVEELYFRLISP